MTSRHPCLFALQRWSVGCDRLPEVTQESPVKHASDSVDNDDLRFEAKVFG